MTISPEQWKQVAAALMRRVEMRGGIVGGFVVVRIWREVWLEYLNDTEEGILSVSPTSLPIPTSGAT
jgi:hypothetical protein